MLFSCPTRLILTIVTYDGQNKKKDTNSLVIILVIIWHPKMTMVKLLVIDILIILGTVMIWWEDYSRKGHDNHDDGKYMLWMVMSAGGPREKCVSELCLLSSYICFSLLRLIWINIHQYFYVNIFQYFYVNILQYFYANIHKYFDYTLSFFYIQQFVFVNILTTGFHFYFRGN